MLVQQNNLTNFLTNDTYQTLSSSQKTPPQHSRDDLDNLTNKFIHRKLTVPRNSSEQNRLSFPFSGSTSTADVPKFGQESCNQLFHGATSTANSENNHFSSQHSNNIYMDINSNRNVFHTSGSYIKSHDESGNSAGTSLATDNQPTRAYFMKDQQQCRTTFNIFQQQTWKDRKDPYSSKPTSTLVDFECISPPPPPKKLFFGSSSEGYQSSMSSSRYIPNSNTELSDHQFFQRNLNLRDFSIRENTQVQNNESDYDKYIPGPSFANQFHTQVLPSHDSNYKHEDYGHFMATAANLVDPWVNTSMLFTPPQDNVLNNSQPHQCGIPKNGNQIQAFQHMMLPPPSPTILMYYQQDPAHFNFNGNHQLAYQPNSNFFHSNEQVMGRPFNSIFPVEEPRYGFSHQVNTSFQQQQEQQQQHHHHHQSTLLHGVDYSNTRNQYNNYVNEKLQNDSRNSIQLNSNGLAEPSQILQLRSNHPQLVSSYNLNCSPVNGNHFTSTHYNRNPYELPTPAPSNPHAHFFGTSNTQHTYHNLTNGHIQQVVPGTSISINDARLDKMRDQILAHAHSLYSSSPKDSNLLPILHCLHELHPKHLPTLLLLACVYFSREDTAKSLYYNSKILEIDPNYVEAMSNIGTTLRSIGRCADAENWWWRAIRLRPGYWDAVENLLGVLCSQNIKDPQTGNNKQPRYKEAMEVCNFVESHVLTKINQHIPLSPKNLGIAIIHTPRVQNLLYTKGNLLYAMGDYVGAKQEYERALEVVFGGNSLTEIVSLIAQVTGVSTSGNESIANLPMVLITPEQATQLCVSLFSKTDGILPGLIDVHEKKSFNYVPSSTSIQQINQTCSNILLTLAKLYQDSGNSAPLQLLLPIYYLSLSLHPSPSTCNNLGILLSTVGTPVATPNCSMPMNGPALAYQYYTYGLSLDSHHPHLYTNLGSLLKDMGRLQDAVHMYEKAVECNPRFDIALANLGNAIKDMGRVQDSIQWYMRAVEVNPDFGEAICGLVNALGGICDWRGRGGPTNCVVELEKGEDGVLVRSSKKSATDPSGWMMEKVDLIVNKQLVDGLEWGRGIMLHQNNIQETFINLVSNAFGIKHLTPLLRSKIIDWIFSMNTVESKLSRRKCITEPLKCNEGGWAVRIIERCMRIIQRRWYVDQYKYGHIAYANEAVVKYQRPTLPLLSSPPVPTVLPFHTFTYPLSPRQIRLISHRNAIRISHSVLSSAWLPATVYPPPPPPAPLIKIGYVSSDFNNHPLSHLMQSVFGLHDQSQFMVYCYATTPNDQSPYRAKIEREAQVFLNVSTWSTQAIVERIVQDGIHILINLNGYTKGARNEVFAARPAPILMSYMGFAGSLGAGWCDYLISDPIVCPPELVACERWRMHNKINSRESEMLEFDSNSKYNNHDTDELEGITVGDMDPEEISEEWVYTEKMIYMPHSYFVNDHRQGFRDDDHDVNTTGFTNITDTELLWKREQKRRWVMRREVFPNLHDNMVIFANFNQLYKIDPSIFKVWLRILSRVPNSILWLLRFPAAGETHLMRTAEEYAGKEVASRVIFTDVAPKNVHIHRGRVADLFLDTPECNGHTTGCDILWSGTPILTFPRHRHKLCSRVAASIAYATGHGDKMVASSEWEFEDMAVKYARDLSYEYVIDDEVQPQPAHQVFGFMQEATCQKPQPSVYRVGRGILMDLRRDLFLRRDHLPLFDTPRWVRNLEKGYLEAWRRWDSGEEFTPQGWSCIWIKDQEEVHR